MNVRVSCNCQTCEVNAVKVGAAFPLAADVNPRMAEQVGITSKNANSPRKVHGLVYAAHQPAFRNAVQTVQYGPWGVSSTMDSLNRYHPEDDEAFAEGYEIRYPEPMEHVVQS